MAKSKFPERLFVKIENPGEEQEYRETGTEIDGLLDVGETAIIAEYKLTGKFEAKGMVTLGPRLPLGKR